MVVDDDLVEGTEELVVSLAIASGSVQINTQNNITVVILDNDCEYILFIPNLYDTLLL